jgi:hypothetical protein
LTLGSASRSEPNILGWPQLSPPDDFWEPCPNIDPSRRPGLGHDGANTLLAALDEALDCTQPRHLSRADRLDLALWGLIESVAEEFEMPLERAAEELVMLCEMAKEMMD